MNAGINEGGPIIHNGVMFLGKEVPSLGGYLTVFTICGCGALLAAVLLFLVPKLAFTDAVVSEAASAEESAPAAP